MASKTFFQVSTIPSARAGVVHAHHSFPSNGKLNFGSRALKSSESLSISSSSSSLFTSLSNAVDYPRNRGAFMVCKARETVNEVLVVTDSSWDNLVISSETPVLVEFWAPWCGPCRMIAPVIDELAKQYAGKIACFKLNTDDCPTIATQYGIRSIPTVLFFKNGEKKESVIGAVPKSTLTTTIEKYVEV